MTAHTSSTAARSGIRRVLARDTSGLGPGDRAHSRPLASGRDPAARRQPFLHARIAPFLPRNRVDYVFGFATTATLRRHIDASRNRGARLAAADAPDNAPALQGRLRRRRELGSRRTYHRPHRSWPDGVKAIRQRAVTSPMSWTQGQMHWSNQSPLSGSWKLLAVIAPFPSPRRPYSRDPDLDRIVVTSASRHRRASLA